MFSIWFIFRSLTISLYFLVKTSLSIVIYEFKRMFLFLTFATLRDSKFVNRSCPGLPHASCLAPSGPSVVSWGKIHKCRKTFHRLRRLVDEWKLNLPMLLFCATETDLSHFCSTLLEVVLI